MRESNSRYVSYVNRDRIEYFLVKLHRYFSEDSLTTHSFLSVQKVHVSWFSAIRNRLSKFLSARFGI